MQAHACAGACAAVCLGPVDAACCFVARGKFSLTFKAMRFSIGPTKAQAGVTSC